MALDKTDDAVGALVAKITALADTHGNDALYAAGRVLQMQAIGNIVYCDIAIIALPIMFWLAGRAVMKATASSHPSTRDENEHAARIIMIILFSAIGFAALAVISHVVDGGTIASALDWRAALAYEALKIAAHP